MRKKLLSLGVISLLTAPMVTLVSCGGASKSNPTNVETPSQNIEKSKPKTKVELQNELRTLVFPEKMEPAVAPSAGLPISVDVYTNAKNTFISERNRIRSNNLSELNDAVTNAKNAIAIGDRYNNEILKYSPGGIGILGGTKFYKNGKIIHVIISDGHDGYWIAGHDFSYLHLDSNGNMSIGYPTNFRNFQYIDVTRALLLDGRGGFWGAGSFGRVEHVNGIGHEELPYHTFIGGLEIFALASDGHGGAFIGGRSGYLDHMDSNTNLVEGWQTKTLLEGNVITQIIPNGDKGFIVAGDRGSIDFIDNNGNLIDGWKTKHILSREDAPGGENQPLQTIYAVVSDGNGGFLVGGTYGAIDHIDSTGNIVSGWDPKKTLLGGDNIITTIISDGYGGFWVGGAGKIDHIDANGDLVAGWQTLNLFNGDLIKKMILDGHGGVFVVGQHGKLCHVIIDSLRS